MLLLDGITEWTETSNMHSQEHLKKKKSIESPKWKKTPFYSVLKMKMHPRRDLWGVVCDLSIIVEETQVSKAPTSIMGLFYFISR